LSCLSRWTWVACEAFPVLRHSVRGQGCSNPSQGFVPAVGELITVHSQNASPGKPDLPEHGLIDVEDAIVAADEHDILMVKGIDGCFIQSLCPCQVLLGPLQELACKDEFPQQPCPFATDKMGGLAFFLYDPLGNTLLSAEIDDQIQILLMEGFREFLGHDGWLMAAIDKGDDHRPDFLEGVPFETINEPFAFFPRTNHYDIQRFFRVFSMGEV
jgi:hypothetical protein